MKQTLFLYVFFFFAVSTQAQVEREQPVPDQSVIQINTNRIYGKLVDKNTNKGIEAASVQLFVGDSLIRGMLTRPNGDFSFDNLPRQTKFRLQISAIGYESYEQVIEPAAEATVQQRDLGNIILQSDVKQLGGVTVVASRPALEMGIDRKVFNAAKSFTATGGTAVDLMKNIPSVSVDIDGNVTLRNSSPQIFVDGRPTILTLDQIPADNIDKVELITNPSAKFDAASSGGIINIVLKKNKRVGLNGVFTAGIGTPRIASSNLNLNLRQGKLNFYLSGGFNQSGGKARSETHRINRQDGQTSNYFDQFSYNDRRRLFANIRFGADYFIDNRNTISLTQQFGRGRFRYEEDQDQQYLDAGKVLQYYGERLGDGKSVFKRGGTTLNYKHSFPRQGQELTADITYNYGNRTENSELANSFFNPDGSVYQPSTLVRNYGDGSNDQVTIQADYVNPVTENRKVEMGVRSYINKSRSLYDAFAVGNGQPQKLPLSNNYEYTERVNAVYFTYSDKMGSFGYQAGLRAEHSQFDGLLIDSAFKFGYKYPNTIKNIWNALFPSLYLTKQLNEDDQMQLNYSRRIRRPNFWQLSPFIDINDPANIRQGNPQLKPEFINSFEFNYSHNYGKGNFLAVLYFRNNPDDITEYSDTITAAQYVQMQNAAVDPNAILNTYINAGVTNRYGAEFTLQHKWNENFEITPTVNLQYRTVKARVKDLDLSNEGFNWDAKLTMNYKIVTRNASLFNKLGFQLLGEYESAEVIPQGRRKAQYSVDFAIRKDFLKNDKANLTFGINDVFNTNRWGTIYDTKEFYQDAYRRWNVRSFRLTFTYKFGDPNFSLTNRNRRDGGGED